MVRLTSWLSAFAFTQLLEVPIYLAAFARDGASVPADRPRRVGLAFLASALTHPYVWFVFPLVFYSAAWDALGRRAPALIEHRYALFFVVAEAFAVLVEALLLRACGLRRALAWALLANATSAGLGFFARYYIGWP